MAFKQQQQGMRPKNTKWVKGKYVPARKVCPFCANKNEVIDYKASDKLRSFITDRGKIESRRRTGVCAKHQRGVATAIKRARQLALLPYVPQHVRKVAAAQSS